MLPVFFGRIRYRALSSEEPLTKHAQPYGNVCLEQGEEGGRLSHVTSLV